VVLLIVAGHTLGKMKIAIALSDSDVSVSPMPGNADVINKARCSDCPPFL